MLSTIVSLVLNLGIQPLPLIEYQRVEWTVDNPCTHPPSLVMSEWLSLVGCGYECNHINNYCVNCDCFASQVVPVLIACLNAEQTRWRNDLCECWALYGANGDMLNYDLCYTEKTLKAAELLNECVAGAKAKAAADCCTSPCPPLPR